MCVACMYVCISRSCLVPPEVRRGSEEGQPLKLELQTTVSGHVGAGMQTRPATRATSANTMAKSSLQLQRLGFLELFLFLCSLVTLVAF